MFSPQPLPKIPTSSNPNPLKRKRNLPGTPDPDAEVIALSPKSLMATNRFMCEICNKGFQRDQNLQLHRRGHNLPWKLRQRAAGAEVKKKVYVCPERSCVHHEASRALGDLTGIKKHFSRKHGEKKWKCEKCSKKYAVHSDWKAHTKICGTREYKCDCGTIFSRKDSFITHRAFCDALADDSSRFNPATTTFIRNPTHNNLLLDNGGIQEFPNNYLRTISDCPKPPRLPVLVPSWLEQNPTTMNAAFLPSPTSSFAPLYPDTFMFGPWSNNIQEEKVVHIINNDQNNVMMNNDFEYSSSQKKPCMSSSSSSSAHYISATALLQKAAEIGSTRSGDGRGVGLMISGSNCEDKNFSSVLGLGFSENMSNNNNNININNCEMKRGMTRDFLGVEGNRREYIQDLASFTTSSMNHYTGN